MAEPGDHPADPGGLEWSLDDFRPGPLQRHGSLERPRPTFVLHITLLVDIIYLYVVADYVDLICIFVSGSDCEFICGSKKLSIIKFQRPCWAIWAAKSWKGIVVPKWKRTVLPKDTMLSESLKGHPLT